MRVELRLSVLDSFQDLDAGKPRDETTEALAAGVPVGF